MSGRELRETHWHHPGVPVRPRKPCVDHSPAIVYDLDLTVAQIVVWTAVLGATAVGACACGMQLLQVSGVWREWYRLVPLDIEIPPAPYWTQ